MQINLRGQQTRPAQTRQDTSKLQDLQRKAQDTQALLSLGQSALNLGKSFLDDKTAEEQKTEMAKLEVLKKTQFKDDMDAAREAGRKEAEGEYGLVTPGGLEIPGGPTFQAKAYTSDSKDEDVQRFFQANNEIHEYEQQKAYEAGHDSALLSESFADIPEDMRDLNERLRFATTSMQSKLDRFKDPEASSESFQQLLSQFIKEEIQYVNGADIVDYNGDYFEDFSEVTHSLPSGLRGQFINDLESAFTNYVMADPNGLAYDTVKRPEDRRDSLMKNLDRLKVPYNVKRKTIDTFKKTQALDDRLKEERIDVTSPAATANLNAEFGALVLRLYAEGYNSDLLMDGFQKTENFIKVGPNIHVNEQMRALIAGGTIFPDGIPKEFGIGDASANGLTFGGRGTGAASKANTGSRMFGALESDDRKTHRTDFYNALASTSGLQEVSKLDAGQLQQTFGLTEEAFDQLITEEMKKSGLFYSMNPDASLEPSTFDNFMQSMIDQGAYLQLDGNRHVIRYDRLGLRDKSGVDMGKAVAAVVEGADPIRFKEYKNKTFRIEPGYSPGSGYQVAVLNENGLRERYLPNTSPVYRTLITGIQEQLNLIPQEVESSPLTVTPEDSEEFLLEYPDLGDLVESVSEVPVETLMVVLEESGAFEGWSKEEKQAFKDDNKLAAATLGTAAAFVASGKAADSVNGMLTDKAVKNHILTQTKRIAGGLWSSKRPMEEVVEKLGGNLDDLMKQANEYVDDIVKQGAKAGVTVKNIEVLRETKYRELLADTINGAPKGLSTYRKHHRHSTLKAAAGAVAKSPLKAAGWTISKALKEGPGLLAKGAKALPGGLAGLAAWLIADSYSEGKAQKEHGMSLEEIQREILILNGVNPDDATVAGAWGRIFEGDMQLADLSRALIGPVLAVGGSSHAQLEANLRSGVSLTKRALGFTESGLDPQANAVRSESNLLTLEEAIDRRFGGLKKWLSAFGGEVALRSMARDLAKAEISGRLIPDSAAAFLEENSHSVEVSIAAQILQERLEKIKATEHIAALKRRDGRLTIMGDRDPDGMTRVSDEDYGNLMQRLVNSSLGEGDIPVEDANEVLSQMYMTEGINPVTTFRTIKEAINATGPQNADSIISRLNLQDEDMEAYVGAFDRYEEQHGFDKGVSREKRYLTWVSRGMPLGGPGEEFYPLNPDVMEALGFDVSDDYMHFTAINYDSKREVVNTIGYLRGDIGEFISYLEDQRDKGNGIPDGPAQLRDSYLDFKGDSERRIQESFNGTPKALRVDPDEALQHLRVEFDSQKSLQSEDLGPPPPPAQESWSSTFQQKAKSQLKEVLPTHGEWPVRYNDTPKEPIWQLEGDLPKMRGTLEKRIQYLNRKIELEQNRRQDYGRRRDHIESMEKTVQVLRQILSQTYSAPDEQVLLRGGRRSSTLMDGRWSAYTAQKVDV